MQIYIYFLLLILQKYFYIGLCVQFSESMMWKKSKISVYERTIFLKIVISCHIHGVRIEKYNVFLGAADYQKSCLISIRMHPEVFVIIV